MSQCSSDCSEIPQAYLSLRPCAAYTERLDTIPLYRPSHSACSAMPLPLYSHPMDFLSQLVLGSEVCAFAFIRFQSTAAKDIV
jgi:hypothetical protein